MISSLASVSKDAQLGQNVRIDPFAVIHEDVVIGNGCRIHSNAVLYPGTRLGEDCEVFPGAVIGVIPQDLKFGNEYTTVEIGNHTRIRECVTIHRATSDKWKTTIGDNCLLMTYVHVAHDCQIGNNVILASYTGLSGHVTIEDWAILEGKAAAQQFTRIGKHAFIGGASLIRKDIPPFIKAAREPLAFAGVNSVGLRRRGYSDEQVREIEDIYRILYVQNSNLAKGITAVEQSMPASPLQSEILAFIKGSENGVIRGMI
ncbi:MAG: hypothetical protein RLZZ301_319 [Bacteroidota bacterium]|jgi:UDP-N-acetylglucosamine acyltransferase